MIARRKEHAMLWVLAASLFRPLSASSILSLLLRHCLRSEDRMDDAEKGRNSEAASTQSMACSLRRAIMTAC